MLINRGVARGVDHGHVVKNQLKIIGKKARNGGGRAHTENVDALCPADLVHSAVKVLVRGFLDGASDLFNILHQHAVQHVAVADTSRRHFYTLHRGQLAANHLLHGLLQFRVTVVAQLCGKANHRALGHTDCFTQLGSCHKCRFIIMLLDVKRDALLSLRKAAHHQINAREKMCNHKKHSFI